MHELTQRLRNLLQAATPGPWDWVIHDHSLASLGVLPDPGLGDPLVMTVSPCNACAERAARKEWEWGRCQTPSNHDATLIVEAVNALPALLDALEAERARVAWRTDALPFDEQPIYQFVLVEGYQEHSGRLWHRRFAGTATISKGAESRFGYRRSDIDRIQRDGDLAVVERVVAWMPATWPRWDFDSLSATTAPAAGAPSQPLPINHGASRSEGRGAPQPETDL